MWMLYVFGYYSPKKRINNNMEHDGTPQKKENVKRIGLDNVVVFFFQDMA